MATSRSRGFTLIELMVTLAVAAILLVVGVPSFTNLMTKSRLSGQIQEFYGAISFARNEAIKRGNSVSICRISGSFNIDSPSCGGNWSDGWIVFVNSDQDTNTVVKADVLRVFPALPTNSTLNASSNFANDVTYDRFGMANNTGTFVFCKSSDETTARAITITKTRPRIATTTETISSCESP